MPVSRLRLRDLVLSRLPNLIGYCQADVSRIADAVNAAQERLLTCPEAGDTGWYGGHAEMVFNVSRSAPYLTLPRDVARLISLNACDYPIPVQNRFYEYLEFGSGRWPKVNCGGSGTCVCVQGLLQAFQRNNVPTFYDIATPNKGVRVYISNPADVSRRLFLTGVDGTGQKIVTQDGANQVTGVFVSLDYPWANVVLPLTSAMLEINQITGVLKSATQGAVSLYEVDLTTGDQRLLSTMEPGETNAVYPRYYFNRLPQGCCPSSASSDASLVQVTGIVKLDLIPALVDTDALLIQSREAIIAECESAKLANLEDSGAKQQSRERHQAAVGYLRGQLTHYEGKHNLAVNFAPFGSARLANQAIGNML